MLNVQLLHYVFKCLFPLQWISWCSLLSDLLHVTATEPSQLTCTKGFWLKAPCPRLQTWSTWVSCLRLSRSWSWRCCDGTRSWDRMRSTVSGETRAPLVNCTNGYLTFFLISLVLSRCKLLLIPSIHVTHSVSVLPNVPLIHKYKTLKKYIYTYSFTLFKHCFSMWVFVHVGI